MKVLRNQQEGKDVLLVYSLGNFISNIKTDDTRGGALVRATIERDAEGKARFTKADYDTFFSAKPAGGTTNFTVIPSWMPEKIPVAQREHWKIFDRGAQNIFEKHNVNVPRRHKPISNKTSE